MKGKDVSWAHARSARLTERVGKIRRELIIAAGSYPAAIEALVALGSDVNALSTEGTTPLAVRDLLPCARFETQIF